MRGGSPNRQHPESIQKQATINSLRKQIDELSSVQYQFNNVQSQIQNAETNYSLLASEKDRIESETQTKIDLNRRAIAELKEDINAIQMQIHKCGTHIDELLRENEGIKRTCYNRDNETSSLMSGNQQLEKKNEHQYQIIRERVNQIKNLKDQRNRKQLECQRLQNQLQENINILKTLQKEARMIESSVVRLQNILIMAQKDHSDLIQEMRTREGVVEQQNRKLAQLQTEIDGLKSRTKLLQQECQKSEHQYRGVCQSLQNMVQKNRQLTKRLKSAENVMRQTQNQRDKLVLERDAFESDHLQLYQQNKILNEQIDKCIREILQYEKINRELQSEAQHYLECDEQARALLNRRERILGVLTEVSNKLSRTSQPISHLTGTATSLAAKRR